MTASRHVVQRPRFALLATCILAALGALHGSSAAAATGDNLPAISAATLGFNGRYKLGCWAPLAVTIRGTTTTVHGALTVELPDGDGVRVRYESETVDIPAGEERDVLWYVKLGRQVDTLTIGLKQSTDEATPPATLRELPLDHALPVETRLILNLGPAIATPDSLKPLGLELVELDASDQLPERWIGYEAVDALVLMTSHPDLITHLTDDTGQLLAAEDWLAAGGRVVICDGSDSRQVLQPDSALGRLVPGKLGEPVTLPRFEALETYSGSAQRIPSAVQKTDSLKVSRLHDVQGVVEATEGDVPMVVRAPRGLGELTYLAVSLDQPPLVEWGGRTALATRLLRATNRENDTSTISQVANRGRTFGIVEMSGQLYAAIDQFEGVRSVPFWLLGALALGYVAVIGPLDFWIVERVLRRPELTWLTLPVLVALPVLAIAAADLELKGVHERFNQVDVIDVDLEQNVERGTSWLAVFTPEAARYDLSMSHRKTTGEPTCDNEALSWFSPPGDGWGGMHSSAMAFEALIEPYRIGTALGHLRGVAIEAANTKAFCARWTCEAPSVLEATLTETSDGRLRGRITNRHSTSLEDVILLFGRWGYTLGSLKPGDGIDVPLEDHHDLDAVLKRLHAVRNEQNKSILQAPDPYDPAALDVATIVQTMMFYDALGGREYTGLGDAQQRFLDLSGLLELGRAVLVARLTPTDSLGGTWSDADQALPSEHLRQWKYCRVVLPVERP